MSVRDGLLPECLGRVMVLTDPSTMSLRNEQHAPNREEVDDDAKKRTWIPQVLF